jgi:Zn ribbon nucleic-acid-binding protein
VSQAVHGTSARWHAGCHCTICQRAHSDTQRAWKLSRAQARLPVEVRQRLLDAIYAGQPFRTVLRDLELTSNRVFGLARIDQEWYAKLEAALTASRREDLEHGTNAAYLHGCVCGDCRAHQQVRMGRHRA